MNHHTDTLSADGTGSFTKRKQDESHNRKRRHRKETHNSKNSKRPSRHSRSDRNKSEKKLKNYDSEYIGPNRLTKHMGFLAKGKISSSISRLEELLPENLRARTKQDLRRILELNASTKTNGTSSGSNVSSSRHHKRNISSSDEESNFEPVSYRSPGGKHLPDSDRNEKCKEKSNKSSVANLKKKALVSSVESRASSKHTPQQSQDEVSVCREIITKKLHSVVASTNNLLFPNSSTQRNLLKELTDIKAKYQASQKVVSNSSNCESSQDHLNPSSSCVEDSPGSNFKLNPVLTQEDLPPPKKMENLFPVLQDYSSSESEEEVYVDAQTLLRRHSVIEKNVPKELDSKVETCSSGRDSSVILIPSSQSSVGSPVWAPKSSPVKFIPEFPPTPKLYFRQKMF